MLSNLRHISSRRLHLLKSFSFLLHRCCSTEYERQHETAKCIKQETILLALYGGRHTVTMLPGTGIGPELCEYVRLVFNHMGAPVDFEVIDIDPERLDNEELDYALISIKRNGVAIKGNIEKKTIKLEAQLRNIILRNELDLYAYILWCKSYPDVPAKYKNIDIILVRQNTEGEYSMLEHSIGNGKVVEYLKIARRDTSTRIATFAFEYAKKHGRKKVTTIHKANIMKLSDGLFLQVARNVAKKYPEIKHEDMIIDNATMQMVKRPHQFDVILAPNLYGNILGNILCGLTGGPGLMAGRNIGEHYTVFEPATRNNGDDIAKKNLANPTAMLSASVHMLEHLGHETFAQDLKEALMKTVCQDKIRTIDLGGQAKSTDYIKNILKHLQ